MTYEEFAKLAKALKAVYTQQNFLPDVYAMQLWFKLLADIPYDMAKVAVENYIATNKFPPTIADIRAYSVQTVMPDVATWTEAWSNVLFAIRAYGSWDETAAMEFLKEADPIAERIVHRLGWKELCCSDNLVSERANFRDAYECEKKRAKDMASTRRGFAAIVKIDRPEISGR